MNFTKKLYQLINKTYKTVKPYAVKLDNGSVLDDMTCKQMIDDAENFHIQPSNEILDQITFTIILNMMYLVSKWAELEGRTPKPDDSKQMDIKETANPKQASGQT